MEALDDLHTAVHHDPAALALAVLEAQLVADLLHPGLVVVRQQPFAPQLLVPGLLVLRQGPLAVGLVALLNHLVELLIGHGGPGDLRHLPAGVLHPGLLQQGDAQGASQVEKDGLIALCRIHGVSLLLIQVRAGKMSSSWLRAVITWSGVNSLPVACSMFRVSGSSMRIIMPKPAAWVPSTSRTGLSPT